MNRRLVFVEEDIFTKDMLKLYEELDKCIKNLSLSRLKNGIEEENFLKNIGKLEEIRYVLKDLSQKKFNDARINPIFFFD